jgi:signal transduction histidine kinase
MEDPSLSKAVAGLLKEGSAPLAGELPVFRELEHARRHLDYLYEISKLLHGFQGVAHTFPRLMGLASQVMPLQTALLLEGVDEGCSPLPERPCLTAWRAEDVTSAKLTRAAERALSAYAYLVGAPAVEPQGPVAVELEGPGARILPEPPARDESPFVILPLVSKGRIFGALQVEAAGALSEEGVAFIDAVAHQLSAALDRHYALRREVLLRERAEALERLQRELLERERQVHQQAQAACGRQIFLSEASALLMASLDYRTTLPGIARLLVPTWADCCAVDLLLPGAAEGERLAMLAAEPPGSPPGRESFVAQVLASHPWVALPMDPKRLPQGDSPVEQAEWAGFPSNARLSIRVRGRKLGTLSLICAQPGRYGPEDLALFEQLAQRIAAAVDSALLYGQAQEAVRWREDLLAVVSHDIKTPLLVVRMNTEMMLHASRPPGEERRRHGRRHLENILLAVEQMRGLISGILDRAREQGMPMPLAAQPYPVDQLFQHTLEVVRPLALAKLQEVEVEVGEGVPRVLVDRDRILQVFTNLVGNAIKYTPRVGTISLRAKKVDGMVRIAVKDTGPGIAHADVPHLFERFWRASGVLERGTGLGLSIAKSIVEAHGGRIWVDTQEGAGSTFFFTLPAAEP